MDPLQPTPPSSDQPPERPANPYIVSGSLPPMPHPNLPVMPTSSSFASNPNPPQLAESQPISPSRKKYFIISGLAVLIVILVFGGVAYVRRGAATKAAKLKIQAPIAPQNDTVTSHGDGTLDLSSLIDPGKQGLSKDQSVVARPNQQINLEDGTSYMLTGVQRKFTGLGQGLTPAKGMEYVKVHVVVGNRNKIVRKMADNRFFALKTSAGTIIKSEYITAGQLADALTGQSLEPGKQLVGSVIYQVPNDSKLSSLTTTATYKLLTTKQTFTIKSEVIF